MSALGWTRRQRRDPPSVLLMSHPPGHKIRQISALWTCRSQHRGFRNTQKISLPVRIYHEVSSCRCCSDLSTCLSITLTPFLRTWKFTRTFVNPGCFMAFGGIEVRQFKNNVGCLVCCAGFIFLCPEYVYSWLTTHFLWGLFNETFQAVHRAAQPQPRLVHLTYVVPGTAV